MPECFICSHPYNREKSLPKILSCACKETICQVCLEKILGTSRACPFDKSPFKDHTVESYPTNQTILDELDKNSSQEDSCDDESEIQKRHFTKKKEQRLKECEKKKRKADKLINKLRKNKEKALNNTKSSSRKEEIYNWALGGLEVVEKKLKVQACYKEDSNSLQQESPHPFFNFRMDEALKILAGQLKISEEIYLTGLKNLVLDSSSLLKQKLETVSQLIQIIQRDGFIGIMPKEFGTGCTDIIRETEVWKNAKKVVIFFKKDKINTEVLQAMAAVFEEFVNVTDVKLDLRDQNMTDAELSLLFERQFWQKSSLRGLTLDMENSKASSAALTAVLSQITADMPQLISLDVWMSGTQLSNEGLDAFGRHTLASLCHLKHFGLIVSECKEISDAGFYLFLPSMIQPLKNLTSLVLCLNNNPQLTSDVLVFLCTSLLKNLTKLESAHFSLAGTKLNDFGLILISYVLQVSLQNIKGLELFFNRTEITDFGAQYFIITILPNLSKAQSLNLSFHKTRIGDATMTVLLDIITSIMKDLQGIKLNLTNTNVSDTALLKYNCKNFCSMKKIQFFELYTHGGCRTLGALENFKLKVEKESAENSSKFKFWPEN